MTAEVVDRGPALRAALTHARPDALADRFGIRTDRPATDIGGSQNLNLLVTSDNDRPPSFGPRFIPEGRSRGSPCKRHRSLSNRSHGGQIARSGGISIRDRTA